MTRKFSAEPDRPLGVGEWTMLIPTDRPPITPGEILEEEFLRPLEISQSELARQLGISFPRVNEVIKGKRPVTTDTALRLGRLFGTTPDFWLNLQHACDLYDLHHSKEAREVKKQVKPWPELARAG